MMSAGYSRGYFGFTPSITAACRPVVYRLVMVIIVSGEHASCAPSHLGAEAACYVMRVFSALHNADEVHVQLI